MAITAIGRYFVGDPNIVSIVTTDDLATITAAGYLTDEQENIEALQNGEFQWTDTDLVLMAYSPSLIGFFTYDEGNATFDELDPTDGLANTLQDGEIFVGSALNIATGVAMSGDVTIDNAGATTIAAGAIDLAMLSTGITPAGVIKFMGQLTTVGGAAAEAFAIAGALAASDRAFVQVVDQGTNTVTVLEAVVTNDTLTVTFSGNPGNDAIINYQLIRAAA